MKITIVTSFFLPVPPVAGGAMEKIWFRLAREFSAARNEVTLVSRRWPGFPDSEVIDGVRILRVAGFGHTRRTSVNLFLDVLWGMRVARRLPPGDIVICNTVTLPVYLSLVRPGAGRVAAVVARMPKGHGRFYRRVDRLIAISQAVRSRLIAENPRLADRTRFFPNPIDWTLHRSSSHKAVPPAPVTIGYVGRLNPEKGVDVLIRAAARLARRPELPPWRLRIVGPQGVAEGGGGEAYVESLRRLADLATAPVDIEPPIYDPVALAKIYGSLDIFCYPSLAEKGEAFGVAIAEAMAAGAAPIVSELACFDELIRDGDTGLVFDHAAPDADARLEEALVRLLTDSDFRREIAKRAQAHVRRFDYSEVAGELLRDLGELVGRTDNR